MWAGLDCVPGGGRQDFEYRVAIFRRGIVEPAMGSKSVEKTSLKEITVPITMKSSQKFCGQMRKFSILMFLKHCGQMRMFSILPSTVLRSVFVLFFRLTEEECTPICT